MKLSSIFPVGITFACFLVIPVNGTWSIVATDRATGHVGGTSATCRQGDGGSVSEDYESVPGVGSLVGQAGTNNPSQTNTARANMEDTTKTAEEVISNDIRDNDNQFGVVKLNGDKAGFTGPTTDPFSDDVQGHVKGDFTYSVQGNRLTGGKVIKNAEKEFKKHGKGGKRDRKPMCDDLADRLIRAIEGGAIHGGGDTDCTQFGNPPADTAYIKVEDASGNIIIDIDIPNDQGSGQDALAQLRSDYDEWRKHNTCQKRPKPHERYLPPLKRGKGILGVASLVAIAAATLGATVYKKRNIIASEEVPIDSFDHHTGQRIEIHSTTPYIAPNPIQL